MSYEFDQSGKLENTTVKTVLAYSNDKNNYVYIKPEEKRKVQLWFTNKNTPRSYIYKTFASLLFVLIKNNKLIRELYIDIEYPGNMDLIKSHLFRIFKKYKYKSNKLDINFKLIGKKSPAHCLSLKAYRMKRYTKENSILASEILKILHGI